MTSASGEQAEFDAYAEDYEGALEQGIRLSGEDSGYFAGSRVAWLGRRLAELGVTPGSVLDFGCGTGSTTPYLLGLPGAQRVLGADVSEGLLTLARRDHGSERARFAHPDAAPAGAADVAYCNGVFHHIPLAERAGAVASVVRALRPGGVFGFWENNPWNPGTRMVMRRIPFDRDAITLTPPEARRLLRAGGLEVIRTDFLFIFPSALARLRPLERRLARAPLGAQYMVLCRKPADG
jgi:SAM-dependent methyltransferase